MKIDYTHAQIDKIEILNIKRQLKEALSWLNELIQKREVGFTELPFSSTDHIKQLVDEKKKFTDTFVLIGIGGSSLGAECLIRAVKGHCSNFFILDNVDPDKFAQIISSIDVKKCCFNIVSKSGSTAETIANFMALIEATKDKISWDEFKKRLVITTDPQKGSLRELSEKEKIASLNVPSNVAGRYSVLSDVGLFPAAYMGIDIDKTLKGAQKAHNATFKDDPFKNPALLIAGIHWLSYLKGKSISVMMPYSERLSSFADWYRQLWAESLGKNGRGQTPVKALGTVDQHSQIQLYNDGPKDKIVTLISVKKTNMDFKISNVFEELESFSYLREHSLKELFDAELLGTMGAFVKYNVPFIHISLEKLDEENMGYLFFVYEMATAISGFLYGINPFDQPAVEEGKRFTYGLLGRPGFEDKRKELKELISTT